MKKTAIVTGITGQDGSYLAKLLLEKGYEVVGAARRSSSTNDWRLKYLGIAGAVKIVDLELLEFSNIVRLLRAHKPSVIFNLAAQSFVGTSFEQPLYTADVDALGVLRFLEAIRIVDPEIRMYQASTSEMFGKVMEPIQSETTPFYPRSPYGVAKLFGHWACVNYRESYGLHVSSGILFNHESPLRGREFVTRKITSSLAMVKAGQAEDLQLGNIDAKRDWGHARDFVAGMLAMTEQEKSDSYVLATGEVHSVREFIEISAASLDWDIAWEGEAEQEIGRDRKSGRVIVRINPKFYRPAEVDFLLGNAAKAKHQLGWSPVTNFATLVDEMVKADMDRAASGQPML